MKKHEDEFELDLRPRESETVSVEVPREALASLERVAASKGMSPKALIKYYIGEGLRTDLSKMYGDHLLDRTAQVLTRHIDSRTEVSAILREIQDAVPG